MTTVNSFGTPRTEKSTEDVKVCLKNITMNTRHQIHWVSEDRVCETVMELCQNYMNELPDQFGVIENGNITLVDIGSGNMFVEVTR